MGKEQSNRIEASLLLNSFLLMSIAKPGFQTPELWNSVAENIDMLKSWLIDKGPISPNNYPGDIIWPD